MRGDSGGGWTTLQEIHRTTLQEIHRTCRTGSVTTPPFLAGGGWEDELTQAEGPRCLCPQGD